jgi:hypothetical protein
VQEEVPEIGCVTWCKTDEAAGFKAFTIWFEFMIISKVAGFLVVVPVSDIIPCTTDALIRFESVTDADRRSNGLIVFIGDQSSVYDVPIIVILVLCMVKFAIDLNVGQHVGPLII